MAMRRNGRSPRSLRSVTESLRPKAVGARGRRSGVGRPDHEPPAAFTGQGAVAAARLLEDLGRQVAEAPPARALVDRDDRAALARRMHALVAVPRRRGEPGGVRGALGFEGLEASLNRALFPIDLGA